jgi:hypothetical protein
MSGRVRQIAAQLLKPRTRGIWVGLEETAASPRRASRLELDTSMFVVSLTLTTGGDLKRQQEVDMCDDQVAQL